MRAGIQIAEYHTTQLHGKVAVVDDFWATVGSSNLDSLSLFLNHEANIVILNHAVVHELKTHICEAFSQSRLIEAPLYQNRSMLTRVCHWLAYAIYRAVMKILTIGRSD